MTTQSPDHCRHGMTCCFCGQKAIAEEVVETPAGHGKYTPDEEKKHAFRTVWPFGQICEARRANP